MPGVRIFAPRARRGDVYGFHYEVEMCLRRIGARVHCGWELGLCPIRVVVRKRARKSRDRKYPLINGATCELFGIIGSV